jgi:hypothetical protein
MSKLTVTQAYWLEALLGAMEDADCPTLTEDQYVSIAIDLSNTHDNQDMAFGSPSSMVHK